MYIRTQRALAVGVVRTTNPKNRYIRLANIKENNNLRDVYYRNLIFNEQEEELYRFTQNSEIASHLRTIGNLLSS